MLGIIVPKGIGIIVPKGIGVFVYNNNIIPMSILHI